jgi:hypothetical protein
LENKAEMLGTSRHTIHHTARHSPGWPTFQYETGDWGCGVSGQHTPGPWVIAYGDPIPDIRIRHRDADHGQVLAVLSGRKNNGEAEANARLITASPEQNAALNYVADMTCIGVGGEWHFKQGYDPQVVLDAIAKAAHPTAAGERGR